MGEHVGEHVRDLISLNYIVLGILGKYCLLTSYEKNPLNLSQSEIKKEIKIKKLEMNKLAKELDFDGAIRVREEIKSLQKELKS